MHEPSSRCLEYTLKKKGCAHTVPVYTRVLVDICLSRRTLSACARLVIEKLFDDGVKHPHIERNALNFYPSFHI